mmetsp:Transcript_115241/g.332898  ORF Transcript_115241/g.332898 Transcript_115241/m.332898 type:complete len:222 (+) Transcript_115241:79-744(+)
MWRLFGKPKDEPAEQKAAPSLQEASAKIDLQVQNLEAKIAKVDEEIKALVAQGTSNPSAKQRCMQAMKQKKLYEQQRDQLIGTQFNVENLAFQQEQAEIISSAVNAMKVGTEQLKKQHQDIDVDSVDRLADDMAEIQDEMQRINEVLAQGTGFGVGVDESEFDAEYARMEEEMVAMKLAGMTEPSAAAAASVSGAEPSAPAPVAAQALVGAAAEAEPAAAP